MEGKMRLAAWCLLVVVVLLLSTQQRPAAALSDEFCRCYKQCYAECRKDSGPYPCNFGCLQDCFNNALLPSARPTSPADCNRICLIRICGVMSGTATAMDVAAGDAEAACLAVCRNSIGHAAPREDTTVN